ncbi:hypothetical protein [Nitrosomonas communis]|uniref:Uncharacterized protein n=1 Tax=Nitrosomonas communis TaxID=44574 RepID=A0A1I4PP23_9PROT|nr:hypothetical protein [Nitrosomonas communis]SFM29434.1 hypothetical protein SAMN05421863_10223 [Nitrosomonas communis]
MESSRRVAIGNLVAVLLVFLCQGCYADAVVDKDRIVQMPLKEVMEGKKPPTILVVRYKVLAAPEQEHSMIQIIFSPIKINTDYRILTQQQEDWMNENTIGWITHYPPARQGKAGEVRLPIPLPARETAEQHFVLFRMLPVHPEGKLEKSRLQIISVHLE